MISERENQYNAFIANTARNVNEKYTERKDTMLQLMEYPTSTISKRIVLHALNEMRAEHMARFMNEPRIRGFNKAKAMLLKMIDQYDDQISREKLDSDLDQILRQDHVIGLCSGHAADMFFWTVSDFAYFIRSYPRSVPRSMEHIFPEPVSK